MLNCSKSSCLATVSRRLWRLLMIVLYAACLGCDQQVLDGLVGDTRTPLALDQLEFVRLCRDADRNPVSMDVSCVRFVSPAGAAVHRSVDLVSAIHIGDASYYDDLNRRFRDYDAVLYELVAPQGTRVRKGQSSVSIVSMMQRQMKQLLELSFQLEAVDYSRRNMVHADLSPQEVTQRMRERGETWMGIMLKMMADSIKQSTFEPWKNEETRLLAAFFAKDREIRLKRIMAEQMSDLERMTTLFEGANGSTLITERNKRAIEVLRSRFDKGERRIAIFYGAGHMPDMARRLVREIHLVPVQEDWLTAWDLRGP
jgi:hypothetical protein